MLCPFPDVTMANSVLRTSTESKVKRQAEQRGTEPATVRGKPPECEKPPGRDLHCVILYTFGHSKYFIISEIFIRDSLNI